jgi:hypothetical protein
MLIPQKLPDLELGDERRAGGHQLYWFVYLGAPASSTQSQNDEGQQRNQASRNASTPRADSGFLGGMFDFGHRLYPKTGSRRLLMGECGRLTSPRPRLGPSLPCIHKGVRGS